MIQRSAVAAATAALAASLALFAVPAGAQGVVSEWNAVKAPPAPTLHKVAVDPAKTALLVMDFNAKNCTPDKRARCLPTIPKVKMLLDKARAHHMLVVYTRTGGMKDSDIVKEVAPQAGEPILVAHANKFTGTDLDKILKDHGITTVITCGSSANGAELFTSFGAAERGYKVIAPVDTSPANTAYAEQFSMWEIANGPTIGGASTLTSADMITF